jgi:OOP family OmpA-OmpF porin
VWGSAILLGLLAAGLVYAEDSVYVETAFGRAQVDESIPGVAVADDANAFRIGLGYDLDSNIAFEASWVSLGEVEAGSGSAFVAGETDGVTVNARFEFPLSETLVASARVGGFFWDSEFDTPAGRFARSGEDLYYGASLDFRASSRLTVSGAWDRFEFGDSSADVLWAGLRLRF